MTTNFHVRITICYKFIKEPFKGPGAWHPSLKIAQGIFYNLTRYPFLSAYFHSLANKASSGAAICDKIIAMVGLTSETKIASLSKKSLIGHFRSWFTPHRFKNVKLPRFANFHAYS